MGFLDRLQHAWSAFTGRDSPFEGLTYVPIGSPSSYRPDQVVFTRGNERSIISAVFTRIAIDVSEITFQHIKTDENGRFSEVINDSLNRCLTRYSNKDQIARFFIRDIVLSMFDNGVVAIVPVDASENPIYNEDYDIYSLRVAEITQWYPDDIQINIYNDITGLKQTCTVPKRICAIVQNPFYLVMNEPNSIFKRLVRKLNILDAIDEQSGSGKMNMIIQLPYMVRTQTKKDQAEERRKLIESQLIDSKYGIAYTDATEKIIQLNRPLENNLMGQIEFLTSMLFSQLGTTQSVLDGTADEKTMLNYHSRTVTPISMEIADEMSRKFIKKDDQPSQKIACFSDIFKLAPISTIAEAGYKLVSSAVVSPNEVRQFMGLKPADSSEADELRNRNLNAGSDENFASTDETKAEE